jgi:hypothetical protein
LSKKGDLLGSLLFAGLTILTLNTVSNDNRNKDEGSDKSDEPFPLNCVHGYVNLDGEGNVLARESKDPPR